MSKTLPLSLQRHLLLNYKSFLVFFKVLEALSWIFWPLNHCRWGKIHCSTVFGWRYVGANYHKRIFLRAFWRVFKGPGRPQKAPDCTLPETRSHMRYLRFYMYTRPLYTALHLYRWNHAIIPPHWVPRDTKQKCVQRTGGTLYILDVKIGKLSVLFMA